MGQIRARKWGGEVKEKPVWKKRQEVVWAAGTQETGLNDDMMGARRLWGLCTDSSSTRLQTTGKRISP